MTLRQCWSRHTRQKNGHARAAIISETTEFAQGVRSAFKASYNTGTVVFDETFESGETDFRALITKLRAANPQMVYVNPQSLVAGELILKQMEEVGLNVAVYTNNAMLDRSAIAANPSLYEEVVMAEVQLPTDGKTATMLAAYEALYGNTPAFVAFTASAYDSVYLLAEAIGSVGEDPEAVAGYFGYQIVDWPGAIGTFNFDENGDAGNRTDAHPGYWWSACSFVCGIICEKKDRPSCLSFGFANMEWLCCEFSRSPGTHASGRSTLGRQSVPR